MKIKIKLKYLLSIIISIIILTLENNIYAASANISASKTTAYVGDSVAINVTVNAAAWNLNVSGSGISGGAITGFNMDGVNQNTSKSYSLNTSSAGTYVVSLKGDVSDGNTDVTSDISKLVTVTIKEKTIVVTPAPVPTPTPTIPQTSSPNSNTNIQKTSNTTPKSTTNTNVNNNKESKSSNAYLSEFRVEQPGITPDFSKTIYNYSLTVGEDVDNLNITAVPEDSKAEVKISGNTNLAEGENTVTIQVTAEDEKTINVYKILVTKSASPEKSNAYLQNILIEGITLKPEFRQDIFEYSLENVNRDSLKILAFPVNDKARVDIIGNENLILGENNIKIIVISENGKMQKTYNLKVIKETLEQSSLKSKGENKPSSGILEVIKENAVILLLYAFVWIEFLQVVYLYERLQKAENIDLIHKDNVHEEAYVDKVKGIIKRIKICKKDNEK